jgi:membrane protein YdbS with pleckstrin-like domain
MKKLSLRQKLTAILAIVFYIASFVFDGAPASFFSIFIAVALTAYFVHLMPSQFKNENKL